MKTHKLTTLECRTPAANEMTAIGLEMLVRIYYDARPFVSADLTSQSKRAAMNFMMRRGLVSAKPAPDDDVGYFYHLEEPGREYVEACLRLPLTNPSKAVRREPGAPLAVFVNAYWPPLTKLAPLSAEAAYKAALEGIPEAVTWALVSLFLAMPAGEQIEALRLHGWKEYTEADRLVTQANAGNSP